MASSSDGIKQQEPAAVGRLTECWLQDPAIKRDQGNPDNLRARATNAAACQGLQPNDGISIRPPLTAPSLALHRAAGHDVGRIQDTPGRQVDMEPVARVTVTVTFLRMDRPPAGAVPALPSDYQVVRVSKPTVAFYRYLYNTVGADYVWWLRRTMPDEELAMLLRDPPVSIHVLYNGGEPAGFFELDARSWPDVNLSYFGLMPHAIGAGVGYPFLRHAVDAAWRQGPFGMTVNTCSADHPRALPTYLRAGFRSVRQVREVWNVPLVLGMRIPDRLLSAPSTPTR
jgi:GNAT superfamily N-acetyltransferase